MTAVVDFYKEDFMSGLFPLKTNFVLIENHGKEISDYIYQRVLDSEKEGDNFLPQQRVYATKPKGHLRRTLKLDPVAEYFIYDLIYRNRACFRGEVSQSRRSFGYKFSQGKPISIHAAYQAYRASLADVSAQFKYSIKFDIASYFNSIYHHDLSHWFNSLNGASDLDKKAFGKYMREINAGRSVDFLPQGIYPCKMIGNEFLKRIDLSGELKSNTIVRFMDDFTLFSDSETALRKDFIRIQQLLGNIGINVNPSKTHFNRIEEDVDKKLSAIHDSLTEIVNEVVQVDTASGVNFVEIESEVTKKLNAEQVSSLISLLKNDSLEEAEADIILGFLRSHSETVLELLPNLISRFPSLIKQIYTFSSGITDKTGLAQIIRDYAANEKDLLEYQLFWLVNIVEDFLIGTDAYGDALLNLYEQTANHKIARAKILEIPEQGFGLKDIRGEFLKTGQSDWLSWAAAVGSRTLNADERNYNLDYFSKGSPINYLVSECVKKL